MQNRPKVGQKHAFEPVLTCLCEILCKLSPLTAKFSIHTHPKCEQFSLICLKKSRSPRPTRARQTVASKPTSGGSSVAEKRTFRLIPWDFPDAAVSLELCAFFAAVTTRQPTARSLALCFSDPCSLFPIPCPFRSLAPIPCPFHSVSGFGRITSRTMAFISATAAMNWRRVRRVEPNMSNSAGVRPFSL